MGKGPTIKQLEYFVAVAKAASFRRAAQKLQVSQPALTLQIAAMEEQMGVQLFDRSRAGTLLSPAGRELLPLARDILEHYQELADLAEGRGRDLVGSFRLGVSPTIGPNLLPRVLPRLHQRYPDLRLHVREEVPQLLEVGLEAGTYDIILTLLPVHAGANKIRPLFTEQLKVLVAADNPLAKKQKLYTRDLHQQAILSMDESHQMRQQLQALSDRFGAKLQSQCEGNSLSSLRLMVMMGMGLAILPALFIEAEMNQNDSIKVYALEDDSITRTHIAAWRKNASSRHLFQKLSFELKTIAMDMFGDVLTEVGTEDNLPDTW